MDNIDAKIEVDNTCENLRQVKKFLKEAATNVESSQIRGRIEEQLLNIQSCLKECENISATLKN